MTDHVGLTSHQAKTLQAEHGRNILPEKAQQSILSVFLSQFKSPLVFVLIIIGIITFFLDEKSDTVVILMVVAINSVIGSVQELKALSSLKSLKQFLTPKAKVYRDGKVQLLDAADLVPTDIVLLESGDRVPADGILIDAYSLSINESQLTGEAYPVSKNTGDESTAAMGTLVASGHGLLKVEKIGEATALGQISKTVGEYLSEPTPLEKQLDKLLRKVLLIILGICALLFVIGMIEQIPVRELFKTVVSIGVSAIPEGLPIVITVTLALGVMRMSRKRAILRNLPSVSSLAGVDVICTDKTGTLTEGNIEVQELRQFVDGKFHSSTHAKIIEFAVLCNDAHIDSLVIGDALDISLLNSAKKLQIDISQVRKDAPRIAELAFDHKRRWQATLHQIKNHQLLIVKGAPDSLLPLCSQLSKAECTIVDEEVDRLADQGLRVLAVACREAPHLELTKADDVCKLTLVGLIVFADTIRSDAAAAIKKCHDAGIQVIMITGDHLNTAKTVGSQVGLYRTGDLAILGSQLEDLIHFTNAPQELTIVARATPFDKSALIDQLHADRKLVAMTGDGVNDAPALVKADIGIAMGKSGTDAARESADMILADDAFATIVDGISAARGIFENIRKVISYLFTTSYGEVGVIFIAMFLQLPLPLLAAQILWLNLITDGLLDISISTESHTPNIMKVSHLRYKNSIIDKLLLLRIILLGSIMSVGTVIIFIMELRSHDLAYARTSAMIVLAIFQWVHALNSRSETRSIFALGFFTNRAVVAALVIEAVLLVLAVYHPFLQQLLRTVPVAPSVWGVAIVTSLSVLVVEELRKYLFQKYGWKRYFSQI